MAPRPDRKPPRRRSRGPRRALLALGLAVAFHLVAVALLLLLSRLPSGRGSGQDGKAPRQEVALRSISAAEWARNRGEAQGAPSPLEPQASPPKPKPPEPEKPESARPPGQVVATAPGNDEVPDEAAFAGETNNRVQKQTQAREKDLDYQNAAPRRTSTKKSEGPAVQGPQAAEMAGNEGVGMEDAPMRPGTGPRAPSLQTPSVRSRDQVAMRLPQEGPGPGVPVQNQAPSAPMQGNSDRLQVHPGQEGRGDGQQGSLGHMGRRGIASLMPSEAALDAIVGSAAPDHLEDVEEGDGTFLNTREWKFASFMNRVKQNIAHHWHPDDELRRRDPTGNIYAGRDRITTLNVTLDEDGELKDLTIAQPSGLDFLDEEAVRAVRQAAPFPHPPKGMVREDGSINFDFGFYMGMSGSPRVRVFRRPF